MFGRGVRIGTTAASASPRRNFLQQLSRNTFDRRTRHGDVFDPEAGGILQTAPFQTSNGAYVRGVVVDPAIQRRDRKETTRGLVDGDAEGASLDRRHGRGSMRQTRHDTWEEERAKLRERARRYSDVVERSKTRQQQQQQQPGQAVQARAARQPNARAEEEETARVRETLKSEAAPQRSQRRPRLVDLGVPRTPPSQRSATTHGGALARDNGDAATTTAEEAAYEAFMRREFGDNDDEGGDGPETSAATFHTRARNRLRGGRDAAIDDGEAEAAAESRRSGYAGPTTADEEAEGFQAQTGHLAVTFYTAKEKAREVAAISAINGYDGSAFTRGSSGMRAALAALTSSGVTVGQQRFNAFCQAAIVNFAPPALDALRTNELMRALRRQHELEVRHATRDPVAVDPFALTFGRILGAAAVSPAPSMRRRSAEETTTASRGVFDPTDFGAAELTELLRHCRYLRGYRGRWTFVRLYSPEAPESTIALEAYEYTQAPLGGLDQPHDFARAQPANWS